MLQHHYTSLTSFSYKIAKKLGMNQMLGLYHDSTLGPVFFSIVNDNDVNEV